MTTPCSNDDIEEFLAKVNLVKETIAELGKNTPDAISKADKVLAHLAQDRDAEEEKQESAKRALQKESHDGVWRKGNGWENEYELFCTHCLVEILVKNVSKCPNCERSADSLMSRKQRKLVLQSRVDKLKLEYTRKSQRRQKWEHYRKLHPLSTNAKRRMTDYAEWRMWEQEIDMSDYMDDNYMPQTAAALAMVTDIQERNEKREAQMRAAVKEKCIGNECMKQGRFSAAIQHYSIAIDYRRDYKALFTNRALAFMKIGNLHSCIDDCTTVIDMITEIDTHQRKSTLAFKAYLRRAHAFQLLSKFKLALKDIQCCLQIRPDQSEAKKLESDIQMLLIEKSMRKKVQQQIIKDKKIDKFDAVLKLLLHHFSTAQAQPTQTQTQTQEQTQEQKQERAQRQNENDNESESECGSAAPPSTEVNRQTFIHQTPTFLNTAGEVGHGHGHGRGRPRRDVDCMGLTKTSDPQQVCDVLFKLLIQKQEYAVRFADENGLLLTLRYLRTELSVLSGVFETLDSNSNSNSNSESDVPDVNVHTKQKFLTSVCKLLNYSCNYRHNKYLLREANYCYLITEIVCSFIGQFEDLSDEFRCCGMHFLSIVTDLAPTVVEILALKSSKAILQTLSEFLLYSPPNQIELKILEFMFDFLENMFSSSKFIAESLHPSESCPHLFVPMFNLLSKYGDYVNAAKQLQHEMIKYDAKQAVCSSILTAMAQLFGPNEAVVNYFLSCNSGPNGNKKVCTDMSMSDMNMNMNMNLFTSATNENSSLLESIRHSIIGNAHGNGHGHGHHKQSKRNPLSTAKEDEYTSLNMLKHKNNAVEQHFEPDLIDERLMVLHTHFMRLNRMFIQFEVRNPFKNLKNLPRMPMSLNHQQTKQVLQRLNEQHEMNISQILKCVTVFMAFSHHPSIHERMLRLSIHETLLEIVPFLIKIDNTLSYARMLRVIRNNMLNYFDQLSVSPLFDDIMFDFELPPELTVIYDDNNKPIITCSESVQQQKLKQERLKMLKLEKQNAKQIRKKLKRNKNNRRMRNTNTHTNTHSNGSPHTMMNTNHARHNLNHNHHKKLAPINMNMKLNVSMSKHLLRSRYQHSCGHTHAHGSHIFADITADKSHNHHRISSLAIQQEIEFIVPDFWKYLLYIINSDHNLNENENENENGNDNDNDHGSSAHAAVNDEIDDDARNSALKIIARWIQRNVTEHCDFVADNGDGDSHNDSNDGVRDDDSHSHNHENESENIIEAHSVTKKQNNRNHRTRHRRNRKSQRNQRNRRNRGSHRNKKSHKVQNRTMTHIQTQTQTETQTEFQSYDAKKRSSRSRTDVAVAAADTFDTESNQSIIIDCMLRYYFSDIFSILSQNKTDEILANTAFLVKQFVIYSKGYLMSKEYLKTIIKKACMENRNRGLKELLNLFNHKNKTVIQNSVTCMAQIATFDEDLRDNIRQIGGLNAMRQLHLQHKNTLFEQLNMD